MSKPFGDHRGALPSMPSLDEHTKELQKHLELATQLLTAARERLTGRLAQERPAVCSRLSEQEDPHYHRTSVVLGFFFYYRRRVLGC